MDYRSNRILRVAVPLKSLVQRFMYVGLVVFCFGLMLIGKIDAVLMDQIRSRVVDLSVPILKGLSTPMATISQHWSHLKGIAEITEENRRLLKENANLKQWLFAARRLREENRSLQTLLNSVGDYRQKFLTTRVIGGALGPFSNSFIVNSGLEHGVKVGQAVVGAEGLVGRITEVGTRSARILLSTDINSRIPVVIEPTRTRAIMVGNNTNFPKLRHLPPGARVSSSERIVTSGHGGVFPPGLPVGKVFSVGDRGIEVQLYAVNHRVEFVRIVDYGVDSLVDVMKAGRRLEDKALNAR